MGRNSFTTDFERAEKAFKINIPKEWDQKKVKIPNNFDPKKIKIQEKFSNTLKLYDKQPEKVIGLFGMNLEKQLNLYPKADKFLSLEANPYFFNDQQQILNELPPLYKARFFIRNLNIMWLLLNPHPIHRNEVLRYDLWDLDFCCGLTTAREEFIEKVINLASNNSKDLRFTFSVSRASPPDAEGKVMKMLSPLQPVKIDSEYYMSRNLKFWTCQILW